MYKNSEGYADSITGSAMSQIMKEYRQKQKKRYADKNRRKIYVVFRYAGNVEAKRLKKQIRYFEEVCV